MHGSTGRTGPNKDRIGFVYTPNVYTVGNNLSIGLIRVALLVAYELSDVGT